MKIIMTTMGGMGDIHPLVELGKHLKKSGHDVGIFSHDHHEDFVTRNNITFHSPGIEIMNNDLEESLRSIVTDDKNVMKQVDIIYDSMVLKEGEKYFKECIKASKGYDCAICHGVDILGQSAMIHNNIPWASVLLSPLASKSSLFEKSMPPVNKFINTYKETLVNIFISIFSKKYEKRIFYVTGVKRDIYLMAGLSPYLNLVAISESILPENKILLSGCRVTGTWLDYNSNADFTPSEELQRFVENSEPFIVLSLGSMTGLNKHTMNTILDTIKSGSYSAIIQGGYLDLSEEDIPGNCLLVEYVPHSYLFQKAGCIIHHCGAGTTAAVAMSGTPSVPVPHMFDQFIYSDLLFEMGVSSKPIPHNKITVSELQKGINEVLTSEELKSTAKTLAEKMSCEKGLLKAEELVIEMAEKHC